MSKYSKITLGLILTATCAFAEVNYNLSLGLGNAPTYSNQPPVINVTQQAQNPNNVISQGAPQGTTTPISVLQQVQNNTAVKIEEGKVNADKIVSSDVLQNGKNENEVLKCQTLEEDFYSTLFNKAQSIGENNTRYFIENFFTNNENSLNTIFDIKKLYVNEILEPASIQESKTNNISEGGKTFTKTEKQYEVVSGSRFRTPYTWQEFLLSGKKYQYIDVSTINTSNKCNYSPEKIVNSIEKGYVSLIPITQEEYKSKLTQLNDYLRNLHTYNRLYLQGKVLPPVITSFSSNIYKNDTKMVLSEEQYIILEDVKFNDNYKEWKTFF